MEWLFGIGGLIVGGAIGAGAVYAWKVRGKILVQAKNLSEKGKAFIDEAIEKAKTL